METYVDDMLKGAKELSGGKVPVICVFYSEEAMGLAETMRKGRKGMKHVKLELRAGPLPKGVKVPPGGMPPVLGNAPGQLGDGPYANIQDDLGDTPVTVEDLV